MNELGVTLDGVTASPSMVTVIPAAKPDPVTVTTWPPGSGPADGVTVEMVGRTFHSIDAALLFVFRVTDPFAKDLL